MLQGMHVGTQSPVEMSLKAKWQDRARACEGVFAATEALTTRYRGSRRVCVVGQTHVGAARKGCVGAVDRAALAVATAPGVPVGADAVLAESDLCTNPSRAHTCTHEC